MHSRGPSVLSVAQPRQTAWAGDTPGRVVLRLLSEAGYTQEMFAAASGISEGHLSMLIRGRVRLTPKIAKRIEGTLQRSGVARGLLMAQVDADLA